MEQVDPKWAWLYPSKSLAMLETLSIGYVLPIWGFGNAFLL